MQSNSVSVLLLLKCRYRDDFCKIHLFCGRFHCIQNSCFRNGVDLVDPRERPGACCVLTAPGYAVPRHRYRSSGSMTSQRMTSISENVLSATLYHVVADTGFADKSFPPDAFSLILIIIRAPESHSEYDCTVIRIGKRIINSIAKFLKSFQPKYLQKALCNPRTRALAAPGV